MRHLFLLCIITVFSCQSDPTLTTDKNSGTQPKESLPEEYSFDWQGHRGARGLMPENTLAAFIVALDHGVKTLEMDVVITKDKEVVISHEPFFNHRICLDEKGNKLTEEAGKKLNIYEMTYGMVRRFDCGSSGNPTFPEQKKLRLSKPRFNNIINAANQYADRKNYPRPFFNIEIKSKPEWDNKYTPAPDEFAKLVMEQIDSLGIKDRSNIQSFDVRALEAVKKIDANYPVALLVDTPGSFEKNLSSLSFTPEIYSPYYLLVTKELIEKAHAHNIKVIPWTVNEPTTMRKLLDLGVDGIITDYPNKKISLK